MPKILVSYRRADSAGIVGRIFDRLIERYGPRTAFLDIDSIPFSTDFRDQVRDTLQKSDAVLAIVGRHWRGVTDGRVRIMEDDDPVRVEIQSALERQIPIFPLLVDGASMPNPSDLPKSIERFAFLNAATIDSGRDFHHHVDVLIASLDALLGLSPAPVARVSGTPAALLRSSTTWAIVAMIAVATLAGVVGLAPPWPPSAGPIAGALAAIAFIAIDLWLRHDHRSAANRLIVASTLAAVALACGYLMTTSVYVFHEPNNDRSVKGFVCTTDALTVYKARCPNLGIDELRGAEYEAERLWTVQSITLVRVLLDGFWFAMFTALAALTAALRTKIIYEANRRTMGSSGS